MGLRSLREKTSKEGAGMVGVSTKVTSSGRKWTLNASGTERSKSQCMILHSPPLKSASPHS
jgi:hypothetical protein